MHMKFAARYDLMVALANLLPEQASSSSEEDRLQGVSIRSHCFPWHADFEAGFRVTGPARDTRVQLSRRDPPSPRSHSPAFSPLVTAASPSAPSSQTSAAPLTYQLRTDPSICLFPVSKQAHLSPFKALLNRWLILLRTYYMSGFYYSGLIIFPTRLYKFSGEKDNVLFRTESLTNNCFKKLIFLDNNQNQMVNKILENNKYVYV